MQIKGLLLSILIIFTLAVDAQVVYTTPSLPIENQPVTIFFDASKGTQGLINYAGDIYAHTGVITNKSTGSSDWKYVKAGWTENKAECKLTRVSTNLYKLEIPGSIRSFYNVPAGEQIQKIALVFRSADQTKEGKDTGGKDIFIDVFTEGLQVSFTTPQTFINIIKTGASLPITIQSTQNATLRFYINGNKVMENTGTTLSYAASSNTPTNYVAVAEATNGQITVRDTIYICIKGTTTTEPMPIGVRDGINYPTNNSATMVLFAPGKESVFILGDFNNWIPSVNYQMKKDGDRFWINIPNLISGKQYAFQYLVDENIRIADPYTEIVLDPWNDKYIPQSVYPNIPTYPTRADGITSVLQPGKNTFQWKNTGFKPDANEKLVIYEALIRDFVATHDIKTLTDTLGYFKRLGINAIELMPFNEFEGNDSWGYNPSYYFATDKYYGQPNDYKTFIDACHSNGIAVIMDMVLNHSFSQSPLVQLYFDKTTSKVTANNPWYNVDSPNPVFSWGYDFNHESAATKYFVDRVVEFWLTEYKVDGFRFDFTKGFTNKAGDGQAYDAGRITILKRIYDKMKSVNPNALMICEHLADNSEEKVLADYGLLLWGNMNYNYCQNLMGYQESSDVNWANYKQRGWAKPNLISYMESHDEERSMYKALTWGAVNGSYSVKNLETALSRAEAAAMMHILMPGPKMIWQFGELGYDYSIDYNGRVGVKPIKWEYYSQPARKQLYDTYSKLNYIKQNMAVFSSSDFTVDAGTRLTKVIKYTKENNRAMAVANFNTFVVDYAPVFATTGKWYEYFSGDSIVVTNANQTITLKAGEYKLYTTERPIYNAIPVNQPKETKLKLYPNPSNGNFEIKAEQKISSISISAINGQQVYHQTGIQSDNYRVQLKTRNSGLFLATIEFTNGASYTQLIIIR